MSTTYSLYHDLTELLVKQLENRSSYRYLNIDETGFAYVLTRRNCPSNYNFEFINGLVSDSSGFTPLPTTASTIATHTEKCHN